ncbi:DUF167 domain-containing protein [Erythrobacter sp. LQ02-29]|uniref:DUF167 domain-containing protein n=1 Tax=Erythrobacter sp. LQ02-29 TaxID=2920384 RepID=UPI001F4E0060|nr:DUF167 domain-containing protein [Erythrobacter sp. LQ02-29]MCP9221814.1 DUF167 domain-containing protein [Erythrobacter sp. LQ02-29]
MARPKADLPPRDSIRLLIDERGRLPIRVTPGARSEGLVIGEGRLLVKVRARPQEGAANAAVTRLVAKALGVAPTRVTLIRGATAPEKLLEIS